MELGKINLVQILLLVLYIHETLAAFSGLYVDNGKDQTVVEQFITRKEKLKFEREMLNILGLSRKPRNVYNSSEPETSASKFLLDIYKSLDRNEVENEFNLNSEDLRSVDESDAIMTFLPHTDHVNSVRHEKDTRLWFDVSDVSVADTIVNAELRLYKQRRIDTTYDNTKFTINIFEVLIDLNGEEHFQYVDAVNVRGDYEGWLVFNVSAPLLNWVVFPTSNKGLYFSVHEHLNSLHEIHPENIGIILTSTSDDESQQPFMIAFLKYDANSQNAKIRRIRDTTSGGKMKLDGSSSNSRSSSNNPFAISESPWSLRNCKLQTLYVSFKDLNWQDWIVAPNGYAAYFCNGICDFPLSAEMNATNHAVVQTLVSLMNPDQAPRPCCVPTKLGPVAVLFYTTDNNAILKRYRKMVAKSCGCH